MNKYIKYIIGLLILGVGISLTIQSDLGAGTWDLLAHGLYLKFSMSVGFWQNINYLVIISLITVIFKRKFNLWVFIPGIILGVFIDLILKINFSLYLNPYTMIVLGSFLCSLGIIIYTDQKVLPNAIDYLMLTLQEELPIKTGTAKLITDAVPLVFGFMLSIRPAIGTLIIFLLVPMFITLINYFLTYFGFKKSYV